MKCPLLLYRMRNKIFQFATGLNEEQTKKMLLVFLAVAVFILSAVFQIIYKELQTVERTRDPNLVSPQMERKITDMTRGYPITNMIPYISQKDKTVAAYLVSIAKKESNWGKHVPVRNGKDCYNYWGFRMKTDYMGSSGHTCFKNPQQAVNIVSRRIDELVKVKKRDTPREMAIWKCGSACAYDKQVGKWISDVNLYYKKLIYY